MISCSMASVVLDNSQTEGIAMSVISEEEKRKHRCCFTGHRPEKLGISEVELRKGLEVAIDEAIQEGFCTFISGMSRGTDLWAASIVLKRKQNRSDIHLICAVPHPDFEIRWRKEWQELYHRVLAAADLICTISPAYSVDCYQRRNCWMVNHSARVIAAFNGSPGGTLNTIQYAQQRAIEVRIIQS